VTKFGKLTTNHPSPALVLVVLITVSNDVFPDAMPPLDCRQLNFRESHQTLLLFRRALDHRPTLIVCSRIPLCSKNT
jgi:hypothetical protein